MALAAVLAAIDGLADGIKGEYRPATDAEIAATPSLKDKFVLDVTPVEGVGLDNVDMLKRTVGTERSAREKAETALAGFNGLDAKAVAGKLEKLGQLEALDPAKEADKLAAAKIDAAKAEMGTAHQRDMEAKDSRIKLLHDNLDGALRIQKVTAAISAAGGNPEVLIPHVLGSTKLVEKDGKFDIAVVDATGNSRIGDAAGNPMGLDQLVGEFKAKDSFAKLFDPSGTSGGGAQGGGGGGGGVTPPGGMKKSGMDLNAKADYIDKHGSEAFLNLPA